MWLDVVGCGWMWLNVVEDRQTHPNTSAAASYGHHPPSTSYTYTPPPWRRPRRYTQRLLAIYQLPLG